MIRSLAPCFLGLGTGWGASAANIEGHRGANQVQKGGLIDGVALTQVDGSRSLGLEAAVEQTARIFQGSTLEEVHAYVILERPEGTNQAVVGKDGSVPLPFFS